MRSLSLLIALILLTACSSIPEPVGAPARAADVESSCAVLAAFDRGDPLARDLLSEHLLAFPGSVDGRRLAQNLRMGEGQAWRIYEEAAAAHRDSPEDAALLYLYARTTPDRARQVELFRRVIELDPSLYWGWYGLGVASHEMGDADTALVAARGALVVRPDDARAMILLAGALERTGGREDAECIYGLVLGKPGQRTGPLLMAARRAESLGRGSLAVEPVLSALEASPGKPALEGMAWSLLGSRGIPDATVLRARGLVAEARTGASLLLRARCHLLLGDPQAALIDLNACAASEAVGFIDRDEWFTAAVGAGDYSDAERILNLSRPALLSDLLLNSRAPGDDRLGAAMLAAGHAPRSSDALAELSQALSACGFTAAAADCASRALALRPADPELQTLLADALAWQAFLEDARLIFERLREAGHQGMPGPTLDEIRTQLATCSLSRLGRDIVTDIPEQSYPFVGSVIRTDGDESPVEWAERGALLVVGQRSGAPVAAVSTRLVGHLARLEDSDVSFDLTISRGSSVTLADAMLGAIAGFTLPGWIVIDLDVIDRTAARIRQDARAAREPDLWPASDATTRRSLWFPGGVQERLASRIGEPGDAVLLATLAHERGHAVDADKYVPFLPNLPRVLTEFASHGFSPSSVEVGLERTAEIWALRFAPDRRVALLNTLLFLPFERSAPPHSVAYHGIVADLVAEIDEHPADYPSIDRGFNILQQLDRLTDDELLLVISRALQ